MTVNVVELKTEPISHWILGISLGYSGTDKWTHMKSLMFGWIIYCWFCWSKPVEYWQFHMVRSNNPPVPGEQWRAFLSSQWPHKQIPAVDWLEGTGRCLDFYPSSRFLHGKHRLISYHLEPIVSHHHAAPPRTKRGSPFALSSPCLGLGEQ